MSSKRLGITTVIDKEGILLGLITDGDLRRIFQANQSKDIWQRRVDELMTRSPKTIKKDCLAGIALKKMQDHAITSLMVVEDNNKLIGVIHLHDLLRANVV
jgi:arabinose-5-phosphate isomerase